MTTSDRGYNQYYTKPFDLPMPSVNNWQSIGGGQIGADQIYGQAITEAQLADGSITSAKIGTISASDITTGTLNGSLVTVTNLDADNITAGTLNGTRIEDLAITNGKLASGAVTAAKITAGTITATEIASSTITGAKIAAGTISASNITSGTITATQIASGTITATQIAAGTITGAKIAAGTISASNIASGTITATQIASGTITAAKIASNTITGAEITTSLLSTVSQYVSGGVAIGGAGRSVSGLDVVGTKNWSMDHPVKEGYDLRHSCIEGPEAADFYRGRIKLGEDIKLPEYYTHIHIKGTEQVFLSSPIPGLVWEWIDDRSIRVKSILEGYTKGIKAKYNYVDWLLIVTRDVEFEVEHERTEDENLLREVGVERYNEIKRDK